MGKKFERYQYCGVKCIFHYQKTYYNSEYVDGKRCQLLNLVLKPVKQQP